MTDGDRKERLLRIATKVGVAVSAFTVFTAGWVAMRSNDWKVMVGVSLLALVAGMIAAGLSRRSG